MNGDLDIQNAAYPSESFIINACGDQCNSLPHVHTAIEGIQLLYPPLSPCAIRPPRQRLSGQEEDQRWLENWDQRRASKRSPMGSRLGALCRVYTCTCVIGKQLLSLSYKEFLVNYGRKLSPGSSKVLQLRVGGRRGALLLFVWHNTKCSSKSQLCSLSLFPFLFPSQSWHTQ